MRRETTSGSFEYYIQNCALKETSSKVINNHGKPYIFQQGHVGILDIPFTNNSLQQCADAFIRTRSE